MADSAAGLERSTEATTYSPVPSGDRASTDRIPLTVLSADAHDPSQVEIESRVKLGARKHELGQDAEADDCYRKALELGDRALTPDSPELVLLLTELTRLYLKKSSFGAAEPLLLRLLDMKRSKGEHHPEVATVLASLATVRQALGRHESAEQLWRRVLDIREATLAPNHFAIAIALEHLGDACAARGKTGESLLAFQRALSIRERTLGAEHPSLRVSRERIADLQLQSEDSLDPGIASSPERFRLISPASTAPSPQPLAFEPAPTPREKFQPAPAPVAPPAPPAPRQKKTSVVIPTGLADVVLADAPPAPAPKSKGVATAVLAAESAPVEAVSPDALAYRETLEDIRDELENPTASFPIAERAREVLSSALTGLARKEVVAGIVTVVLLLLVVGALTDSHAFGESQTTAATTTTVDPVQLAPASTPLSSVASSASLVAATTANAASNSAKVAAPQRARVVEERPVATRKEPEKKLEPKIVIPSALSNAVMSRFDSLASKTGATAPIGDIQLATPTISSSRRTTFDDGEPATTPQRARLIGDLPMPHVPAQVADVEGEVRVRFNVDVDGRPVMSTFSIVNSPNPLLSNAVRKVIPTLRFEPARTSGQDSRPIVDVVQVGFQFSRRE